MVFTPIWQTNATVFFEAEVGKTQPNEGIRWEMLTLFPDARPDPRCHMLPPALLSF
jgi:hypothetical protein